MAKALTNKELQEEVFKVNELLSNRTREYQDKIISTEKELASANAQLRMAKQDIDRRDSNILEMEKSKIAIKAAILSRLASAHDKDMMKQTEWVRGQELIMEETCDEVRFLRFLHSIVSQDIPF